MLVLSLVILVHLFKVMSVSRFVKSPTLDGCFSPITVYHNGDRYLVPCGKCDACRLSNANSWSFRVGDEILHSPYTIWFTLTYDNKYVPKLKFSPADFGMLSYTSDNSANIRYNTVVDVQREDNITGVVSPSAVVYPIQNYKSDGLFVPYCSKRDIQLFLKLLRKYVYERFNDYNTLRYYIISEYGPTTLRPHYHGLLFLDRKEVAEYCQSYALYQSWQMCDKTLFNQYCKFISGGVEQYVTQYVTGNTRLPPFYQDKCIRPFRLASKAPSIGYRQFATKEVFARLVGRYYEYDKAVSNVDQTYVFAYPKNFMLRLYPKCFEFNKKTYRGLLSTYGLLYFASRIHPSDYDRIYVRLCQELRPSDFTAARMCYKIVSAHPWLGVDGYVDMLLDILSFYKLRSLRAMYEWQELNADKPLYIFLTYVNSVELLRRYPLLSDYEMYVFMSFAQPLGVDPQSFVLSRLLDLPDYRAIMDDYRKSVLNAVSGADKSKKVNEMANPLIFTQ